MKTNNVVVSFYDTITEKLFLSFSEDEKQEFVNDLELLNEDFKKQIKKTKIIEGKLVAHQRLKTNRYFKVELIFSFVKNKGYFIFIEQLKEFDLDGYLDSINECKLSDSIQNI